MDDWIDQLAAALGEDPLSRGDAERLLAAARDVAHRVERRTTPLAAFLLGSSVGHATDAGQPRADALAAALETLDGLLPEAPARA
ncbi:MAG: DUF6457 domain-containing protein [Actinomycetota bacterium]